MVSLLVPCWAIFLGWPSCTPPMYPFHHPMTLSHSLIMPSICHSTVSFCTATHIKAITVFQSLLCVALPWSHNHTILDPYSVPSPGWQGHPTSYLKSIWACWIPSVAYFAFATPGSHIWLNDGRAISMNTMLDNILHSSKVVSTFVIHLLSCLQWLLGHSSHGGSH